MDIYVTAGVPIHFVAFEPTSIKIAGVCIHAYVHIYTNLHKFVPCLMGRGLFYTGYRRVYYHVCGDICKFI